MSKERSCSLPICGRVRLDTVHRLPAAGARRNAWLTALSDYREHLEKLQNPFICARHFRPEDYLHADSRKLNRVAVPSLNIKELNQLDICKQVQSYYKEHCDVETYEDITIVQRKSSIEVQPEILSEDAEEVESKRLKLSDDVVSQTTVKDDNIYMTLDELQTSLLGGEDKIEIQEYVELDDDDDYDDDDDAANELVTAELNDVYSLNSDENDDAEEFLSVESSEHATMEVKERQSLEQVNDDDDGIIIQLGENELIIQQSSSASSVELTYLWLRDICKCCKCFDTATHERLLYFPIANVQAISASLVHQDNILIEWHDRHVSTYSVADLLNHNRAEESCIIPKKQMPWSLKQTIGADFAAMLYHDLICSYDAVKTGLKRLQRFGILLVDGICASEQQKPLMLELLLRRLFPHNHQNLAKEQRVHFNTAQSFPHTNCTFLSESCGLQLLSLSSAAAPKTTELTLVDGLSVAQKLYENSRKSFEFLTQLRVPLIYRNAQNFNYEIQAPVIHFQNDVIERIQYAPFQRGNLAELNWKKFSSALGEFTTIVKQPEQQWKLCLSKDMIIILDNWRICWQIEELTSQPAFDCFYIERKEYLSQLHCLERESC